MYKNNSIFSLTGGDFSSILHHHPTIANDFEEIELKTRTPAKSRLDLDPDSILAISTPSS